MRQITAGSRTIHCVEEHHQVLAAWAGYRLANPGKPAPLLVTLDHHTDTEQAFLRAYPKAKIGQFVQSEMDAWVAPHLARLGTCQPSDVDHAIQILKHDEHIDAAEKAGIVSGTFILFTGPGEPKQATREILKPRTVFEAGGPAGLRDDDAIAALTLEPETIDRLIQAVEGAAGKVLEDVDYILDIDLDVFLSKRAAQPVDETSWHRLISGAALITVAMERRSVLQGRLEGEKITAASLLAIITDHAKRA